MSRGFYECEKCNILIRVESKSKQHNGTMQRKIIHKCPSCYGEIKNIPETRFNNVNFSIFIRINRKYYKKIVNMGVKFL